MDKNRGLEFIDVNLSNRSKYITNYFVKGVRVTMRCGYNTRNKLRWIILLDSDGEVLLPQTFIKFGKRCELGFLSNQYNLNFYVTLRAKDPTKTFDDYDYLSWSKDFDLCFVGYDYDLKVNKDLQVRKYLVGN